MPTPTYTPLATVTLGSNTAEVSFGSIPSTFRDLVLVLNGGIVDGTFAGKIFFNNDTTGANYTRVSMRGDSGGATSNTNAGSIRWEANATANMVTIFNIMDYSATDKHKTVLSRANGNAATVEANAGRYASTSAITSLKVLYGTDMKTGMTLNLYGIAS